MFNVFVLDNDYCKPKPCKNGGLCVDITTTYRCDCVAGFAGADCETGSPHLM